VISIIPLYEVTTVKVKEKCTLVQAVWPIGGVVGSSGIALLFHDHGTRRG